MTTQYTIESQKDSSSIIKQYKPIYQESGFFTDSAFYCDDSIFFEKYVEDKMKWGSIVYPDSLKKDFSKLLKIRDKPVDPSKLEILLNDIVKQKVNNGYPFFSISTKAEFKDSVTIDLSISAEGYNHKVIIDTVVIPQNSRIKQKYINRYLRLLPSDSFNYELVNAAKEKLARLSFVTLKGQISTRFSPKGVIIEVPVEARTTGSVSGIIGFATKETSNKLSITGDFNLKLINALKNGEMVNILWKSSGEASQTLFAEAELPFLFNTPLGFYANIDMNKQDTTFLNVQSNLAVVLYFNGINQFQIGTDLLSNRFLTKKDSSVYDTKTLLYKGRLIINNTNNQLTPSKGYEFDLSVGIGSRKTLDSLSLSNTIFRINGNVAGYLPLFKRSTLMGAIAYGAVFSESRLWNSEMFILGGTNSIRGFDELSFYSTRFSYATIEYRYLFERRSYALAFSQIGYSFLNSIEQRYESMVFSIGLGTRIDTGAGMFTLLYALGQSKQQPMKLKNSKVHFGYIVMF